MIRKTLKKLKETKEGEKIKMDKVLKNKDRNNINSFSCNNSNPIATSWSEHKFSIR